MNIILIIIFLAILMILAWAIFSNKTETVAVNKSAPEKEDADEPEKILRRRSADRAIEKEFPGERRGDDFSPEGISEKDDITGQMQLPFPANDIIADGSRFKLYKRALINSEIYAKRGDIETAVSLFKGVKDRILDNDIRSKIESNINYLNHFRHRREEDFKKRVDSAATGGQQQGGELRLRIDGPVPQTINIGMPEKSFINTDEIIQKLSEQITKELGTLKNDIDRLKSKPEDKFDLDDYAQFSNLQHEFNALKERLEELTEERENTLKELTKLREMKEEEIEKDKIKDNSPENNELLKDIRKEIDNLSGLKHSLDSLHNKIEDISSFNIPESKTQPALSEAKFDSPEPLHFDPKPVLEMLDKINQQMEEDKAEKSLESIFDIPEDISGEELTTAEAEDLLNEKIYSDDKKTAPEETLFHEPEITETPVDTKAKDELEAEEKLRLEKEKEIEKHTDAEEDPNAFDLVSEIGKVKDDSTLTDEDIFEKILKDEKNKNDDSAFEIIGDIQKEDQELSFNDSILDGKMKAEQDFYKKFIKADRIKKKELPILKVSYDFKKLPDEFSLSREKNILEYSYSKYKPMLEKADEFIKHRHVRDAINYYRVVLDQNIPIEFKAMIKRNIRDLTEYLEKYLSSE